MHFSSKTYGHECGFSAAFRQWRAASHCALIHGYALKIKVTFAARQLDDRNWVVDFGGLRDFKAQLAQTFDHKTLVAEDDPELAVFQMIASRGLIEMVVVRATGCEAFAKMVYHMAGQWLADNELAGRVRVTLAEVHEHGGNSAGYSGGDQ